MSTDSNYLVAEVPSIYPEIREFFEKTGLPYNSTALDKTKLWFETLSENQEVHKRIDGIYRLKAGDKEYCFWSEQWESVDSLNNPIQWGYTNHKVEVPYAENAYDEVQDKVIAVGILGYKTKYDREFNKETIEEAKKMFHEGTRFYIQGDRLYSTDRERWLNDSYEDLTEYGRTGKRVEH